MLTALAQYPKYLLQTLKATTPAYHFQAGLHENGNVYRFLLKFVDRKKEVFPLNEILPICNRKSQANFANILITCKT